MEKPAKDMPDAKDTRPGKELGMSKFVYAAGNSFKDGAIWGTLATVLLLGGIAFGKGKAAGGEENLLSRLAGKIEKWHQKSKSWLGDQFGKLLGKNKSKLPEITATELGASLVTGAVVGHLVQVPSFRKGWKQAQKGVDRFDALNNEKQELVLANARLIEENQRYRSALDKNADPATFAERVQKPEAESATFTERVQNAAEPEAGLAGAR